MTNPENPNTGHNQFFQEKGVLFLLLLILEMEYIQDISFTKVNRSLSRSICFYRHINYILIMTIIGIIDKKRHKNYYGFLFLTCLVALTSISYMSMSSNSLIGNAWALRPQKPPIGPDGPDVPPKPVDPCRYSSDDPACGCGVLGCPCPGYLCPYASNQVSPNLQEISNNILSGQG